MKKKASAFWELVKTPTILVAIIGLLSGSGGWLFNNILQSEKENSYLKAKDEYRDKLDKALSAYNEQLIRCAQH